MMKNSCENTHPIDPDGRARDAPAVRSYDRLGLVCLAFGLAGALIVLVGGAPAMPWQLQRVWLHSPSLLLLGSVALMIVGGALIWRSEHPATAWLPSTGGTRFETVLLYTRAGCGLCEEAVALLTEYRAYLPPLVEVDIDTDPELVKRFDTCVPVIEIDGKVRFRGRVSEVLLRRLIESTPPLSEPGRYARTVASGDEFSPTGELRRPV